MMTSHGNKEFLMSSTNFHKHTFVVFAHLTYFRYTRLTQIFLKFRNVCSKTTARGAGRVQLSFCTEKKKKKQSMAGGEGEGSREKFFWYCLIFIRATPMYDE